MDEAVSALTRVVLRHVKEKGLDNIDLWYLVDRVTGKRVFLLDEALGVEQRMRLSPKLGELCAGLGAFGLSYRKEANVIELIFGEQDFAFRIKKSSPVNRWFHKDFRTRWRNLSIVRLCGAASEYAWPRRSLFMTSAIGRRYCAYG